MFGNNGIGILSEDFVLKFLVRGGLLAEINVKVGKTGFGEVTLLKLFGDLLIEVEQLEFKKLLELVLFVHFG